MNGSSRMEDTKKTAPENGDAKATKSTAREDPFALQLTNYNSSEEDLFSGDLSSSPGKNSAGRRKPAPSPKVSFQSPSSDEFVPTLRSALINADAPSPKITKVTSPNTRSNAFAATDINSPPAVKANHNKPHEAIDFSVPPPTQGRKTLKSSAPSLMNDLFDLTFKKMSVGAPVSVPYTIPPIPPPSQFPRQNDQSLLLRKKTKDTTKRENSISPTKRRYSVPDPSAHQEALRVVGSNNLRDKLKSTSTTSASASPTASESNPVQDLLNDRISEIEFANAVERQPPQMRWLSMRNMAGQFKRLLTLLTFTTSISAELDLEKSSEKVAQHVCEILNADRASLYLIDEEKGQLFAKSMALNKRGVAQRIEEIKVPLGVGIAGHVAVTGETINVADAYKSHLFWTDVDRISNYRTKTVLCMPVMDDIGRVVAVVEALNKRKPISQYVTATAANADVFTEEDEQVMRTLAHHAGISLRNSQLYQSSQLSQRKIQVLLEVASQLASELETTSLITQIMTKARELLDADRCTLFLVDAERGELWSKVAEGAKEIRIPVSKGIAGYVVSTGEVLNIKDAYADNRFNPEVDKRTGYRTKSILCMPLRNNKAEIVGVTQMINKKDGGIFTNSDESLLTAFSSQAAVAIQNAKLFQKTLEMTNYLQSILQSITNLVLTLDLQGKFLTSNHPVEEWIGINEKTMMEVPYATWLGEHNKMLSDDISVVYSDPARLVEKTDYELKILKRAPNSVFKDAGRKASKQDDGSSVLSINYKVVPLLDSSDQKMFQGVVLILEDVTPQKRMMSTLNRYMSPALAEQVVKEGGDRLGGVHLQVTTLFADIRDFTPLSEGMDAADVVGLLNEYFSYMVGCVFDHGGVLDKYIGDAMMAVFGVPFPASDDPIRACSAALEMLQKLRHFNEKRKSRGEKPVNIGIGLNTGKVLSGNIGSEKRLEYTVIGDGVNLASRIEGVTKQYGVKILLSEFTQNAVEGKFITREIDSIRVVGKQQPVRIFELLGRNDADVPAALYALLPLYNNALMAYRNRQFQAALGMFLTVSKEADDLCSEIFVKRCEMMIKEPPAATWNGVFDMAHK